MEGIIVNFRGGRHTQYNNQMIIEVEELKDREKAKSVVGKKVSWLNEKGNSINGKVASAHGNSGCVRAIFEKGMPGQSIGKKVNIE